MGSTSKDVIVTVTKNGVAFDTPSEVSIQDEGEIPTCQLTFPAGMNSRYKILKKDVIRVFVGLDAVPETATFTGHLYSETAKFSTHLDLVGSLNRAVRDNTIVNDYANYDGQTIENAILNVFNQVSELSWMTTKIEQTYPSVIVPKGTRFENGVSKYDLMKQFREFASGYSFFQHGNVFHFRKNPNPDTVTTAHISLSYGDGLLNFEYDSNADIGFNYARVIGKDGVTGEFQNDHRIAVDGLNEMDIVADKNILNGGEAYEIARQKVLESLFTKAPLNINSHLLLDAVPNHTVVEITGAPFGLSDKYLVRSKRITIAEGIFDVQCQVTTPMDVLSGLMGQLLSLGK